MWTMMNVGDIVKQEECPVGTILLQVSCCKLIQHWTFNLDFRSYNENQCSHWVCWKHFQKSLSDTQKNHNKYNWIMWNDLNPILAVWWIHIHFDIIPSIPHVFIRVYRVCSKRINKNQPIHRQIWKADVCRAFKPKYGYNNIILWLVRNSVYWTIFIYFSHIFRYSKTITVLIQTT